MTLFLKIALWGGFFVGNLRADQPNVLLSPSQNLANSDSTIGQAVGFTAMGLGVAGGIGAMVADSSWGSGGSRLSEKKKSQKKARFGEWICG